MQGLSLRKRLRSGPVVPMIKIPVRQFELLFALAERALEAGFTVDSSSHHQRCGNSAGALVSANHLA